MNTIDFYNSNSSQLIDRYDNADMSSLHQLFLTYIPYQSSVLDIGFGSGRDLQFLHDNNYDIWGIDPSSKFVKNAQQRFPDIQEHFIKATVSFDTVEKKLNKKFDAVIAIAMWMHLKRDEYMAAVKTIISAAKSKATVIISFSEGNRADDERYFEEVDMEYITQIFAENGFELLKTIKNKDSLNRDSLTWITVIYRHD